MRVGATVAAFDTNHDPANLQVIAGLATCKVSREVRLASRAEPDESPVLLAIRLPGVGTDVGAGPVVGV